MQKHVLVIGAGSVGKRHLKNLATLECRVSAIDPRKDRLDEAACEMRLTRTFKGLDEALRSGEKFDGGVICSPPKFHVEQSIACLKKGIPILIEKPLSTDASSAKELIEVVDSSRIPALLGYTYRWWPPLNDLKNRIQSGEIGKPLHVRCVMSAHLADWHPWEPYKDFFMASQVLGGGALLDESHFLDLALWLFGSPRSVYGKAEKLSDLEIETDDNVDVILSYQSGLRIAIHLDLFGRPHEKYISAVGDLGTLIWSFEPNVVRFSGSISQDWETQEYSFQRNDMFVNVAREFLAILDDHKHPISCTVREGYNVMRIIEAIRQSSRNDKVIHLESML